MVVGGLALPWAGLTAGEVERRYQGQLRPGLVTVPAGTFWMGSPDREAGRRRDDEWRHSVTLTHAFDICETEVTQAQWDAVMGSGTNPSDCDYGCGDDVPVHDVSWEMALEYLNALSVHEGLEPCYVERMGNWVWATECTGYRLPTEAEWEYAARGGTETAYSFGDDASRLGDYAWHDANSDGKAHPVGTKMANPWGLYDVHGNVWEWVWDWYKEDYGWRDSYEQDEGRSVGHDPLGPFEGKGRVLRGGALEVNHEFQRSAYRERLDPSIDKVSQGFRCARGPHPGYDITRLLKLTIGAPT